MADLVDNRPVSTGDDQTSILQAPLRTLSTDDTKVKLPVTQRSNQPVFSPQFEAGPDGQRRDLTAKWSVSDEPFISPDKSIAAGIMQGSPKAASVFARDNQNALLIKPLDEAWYATVVINGVGQNIGVRDATVAALTHFVCSLKTSLDLTRVVKTARRAIADRMETLGHNSETVPNAQHAVVLINQLTNEITWARSGNVNAILYRNGQACLSSAKELESSVSDTSTANEEDILVVASSLWWEHFSLDETVESLNTWRAASSEEIYEKMHAKLFAKLCEENQGTAGGTPVRNVTVFVNKFSAPIPVNVPSLEDMPVSSVADRAPAWEELPNPFRRDPEDEPRFAPNPEESEVDTRSLKTMLLAGGKFLLSKLRLRAGEEHSTSEPAILKSADETIRIISEPVTAVSKAPVTTEFQLTATPVSPLSGEDQDLDPMTPLFIPVVDPELHSIVETVGSEVVVPTPITHVNKALVSVAEPKAEKSELRAEYTHVPGLGTYMREKGVLAPVESEAGQLSRISKFLSDFKIEKIKEVLPTLSLKAKVGNVGRFVSRLMPSRERLTTAMRLSTQDMKNDFVDSAALLRRAGGKIVEVAGAVAGAGRAFGKYARTVPGVAQSALVSTTDPVLSRANNAKGNVSAFLGRQLTKGVSGISVVRDSSRSATKSALTSVTNRIDARLKASTLAESWQEKIQNAKISEGDRIDLLQVCSVLSANSEKVSYRATRYLGIDLRRRDADNYIATVIEVLQAKNEHVCASIKLEGYAASKKVHGKAASYLESLIDGWKDFKNHTVAEELLQSKLRDIRTADIFVRINHVFDNVVRLGLRIRKIETTNFQLTAVAATLCKSEKPRELLPDGKYERSAVGKPQMEMINPSRTVKRYTDKFEQALEREINNWNPAADITAVTFERLANWTNRSAQLVSAYTKLTEARATYKNFRTSREQAEGSSDMAARYSTGITRRLYCEGAYLLTTKRLVSNKDFENLVQHAQQILEQVKEGKRLDSKYLRTPQAELSERYQRMKDKIRSTFTRDIAIRDFGSTRTRRLNALLVPRRMRAQRYLLAKK